MSQPAYKSELSGRTRVRKYTVWSLDVWGHGPDECDEHKCDCMIADGEHDDGACECHWDVNDRCRVGEIEVTEQGTLHNVGTPHQFESFSATDTEIIEALLPEYLRGAAENFEIDDPSCDGFSLYVNLISGEPLLELESVSGDAFLNRGG